MQTDSGIRVQRAGILYERRVATANRIWQMLNGLVVEAGIMRECY